MSSSSLRQGTERATSAARATATTVSVSSTCCQLLEKTLTSLVQDAAVLRRLAILQKQISTDVDAANESSTRSGDNNNDSSSNSNNNRTTTDIRRQLLRLERVVSELEDKMQQFRDVVKVEQKAIGEIERSAAEAQTRVLEFQEWQQKYLLAHDTLSSPTTSKQQQQDGDENVDSALKLTDVGHGKDDNNNWNIHSPSTLLDDLNKRISHIQLQYVTREEFLQVPRATRGHIQRALVNEAITDITRTFQEKEATRLRNLRKRATLPWGRDAAENVQQLTCSEQELRQSCAFFLSGEGSARGVLMILRHLHRIKQIALKNGKIVYALP